MSRKAGGKGRGVLKPAAILGAWALLAGSASGCSPVDATLPRAGDIEAAYTYEGTLTARMNGNVAEVTITQSPQELRRGGSLWAKVGPYVLLFSRETRSLFEKYPGLAGVRVVTVSGGNEVARALLPRDTLTDLTWRRSLNIAGLARRDGTRRPSLLEELVRWGEDHTRYEYSPRYTRP